MAEEPTRVLIVKDEPSIRRMTVAVVRGAGMLAWSAEEGEEALTIATDPRTTPDVVLVDYDLPGLDGMTLALRLHEVFPNVRVIMVSGRTPTLVARSALRAGATS